MKKTELLAPCGNFKTLKVAVQSGADAVYLGADRFSARAFAGNFTLEELAKAIQYTRENNVLVYLALNTLMTDRELPEAMEIVSYAQEQGVSAFILQDIGLAKLIKKKFPSITLHASTQMTAKSIHDVEMLGKLGFSRVILARELSREQIKEIQSKTSIELEVFVHGALCSSYSGQCLMSSFIGGRSANRGKCAQPCRLPYSVCRAKGTVGQAYMLDIRRDKIYPPPRGGIKGEVRLVSKGVLLSLKDLCLIDYVSELANMGIAALKIEGRMKGEDYIRAVVSTYRKALDGQKISDKEKKIMLNIFNRGGYTDGYYTNNKANMYMDALSNPYK